MKVTRKIQHYNATNLLTLIEKCETEEAVEEVDDLALEMVQAKLITKKAYRFIEEVMDDRIMDLVMADKI